jgi:protein SCO1
MKPLLPISRSIAFAAAALFAVAMCAYAATKPELKTGAFDPPRSAPDFSLKGSNGSEIKLSGYRGKVIALGFGYTSCPDVCPTTLLLLAEARKKLGVAGKDFQVVYVTVDPERDDVERLRKFVSAFDRSFIGATGSPAQIADVRKAYGVQATRQPLAGSGAGYLIHHSASVYLIDRNGNIRTMMPYGVSVDDVAHDVKALLGP